MEGNFHLLDSLTERLLIPNIFISLIVMILLLENVYLDQINRCPAFCGKLCSLGFMTDSRGTQL